MLADLAEMPIDKKEKVSTSRNFSPEVHFRVSSVQSEKSPSATDGRHEMKICFADSPERLSQAGLIVSRMYSRRGYRYESIIRKNPHATTLIMFNGDGVGVGTVTIGMDSPEYGLLSGENYGDEVNALRARGRKICEFNGLAVDSGSKTKLVIARLFHIAMLVPWRVFGCTDGLVEVNPSHVSFYENMLGFRRIGPEKVCPRVNAPSVLLHVDFSWAGTLIAQVGGSMARAMEGPALFPYFFGESEVPVILDLMALHPNLSPHSRPTLPCTA